ncbi:hypothetical protein LGQ02_01070 [Bacillus shivajii]|uniref:hypothetical protein n=1 Tax=Bacillus shivajii TaxID=1983719 RepID=UPI001CF9FB65|nr:hypothetical protein [Bacillus shivajii]UCZ53423.1 hypothetical protein LGQ02_01070 [Bacillus shivajii]
MILCEWREFTTDTETYSKEMFETLVNDEFEAMMFEENCNTPSYIWTVNHVCIIKQNAKLYSDISITKIPRNPVCE